MNQKTSEFKENFERLKEIEEKVSTLDASSIDEVIPMVEEASKIYAKCKERIEKVKSVLQQNDA